MRVPLRRLAGADVSTQVRRKMNMSDNQGQYECACRVPARYGSVPKADCADCDGTGYTNNPDAKKDWSKNPPPDMD